MITNRTRLFEIGYSSSYYFYRSHNLNFSPIWKFECRGLHRRFSCDVTRLFSNTYFPTRWIRGSLLASVDATQRLDLFGPEDGDRYSSDTYSPIIATGLIDGGRVPVRASVSLSVCQSVVLCQSVLSGHDNKTAWQKVTNSSTLCWDFTRCLGSNDLY